VILESEHRVHFDLSRPAGRLVFASLFLLLFAIYLCLSASVWMASHYAGKETLKGLQTAARLRPGDSDYQSQLGEYFLLAQPSADEAVTHFLASVRLNPNQARAWFGMAEAYQMSGDREHRRFALEQATVADPTTPEFSWQVANLDVADGDFSNALPQLKKVMQYDLALTPSAIRLSWRIMPDMDSLLGDAVPISAPVYAQFLEFLISQRESDALAKLWTQMVRAGLPIERRHVFEYVQYLVLNHQPLEAASAWSQAGPLAQLQSYQPAPANLVVNGDFSSDVLNGGFDWLCQQSKDVRFALDPTQSHGGHRSLLVDFDSRGLSESGLRQFIAVNPNTSYDFSAYFKTEDLRGAGGPQIAIQDAYNPAPYFASSDLSEVSYWKQVSGSFTTGPTTQLLVLHLQRSPGGSPIRGKLWIDDIRLSPSGRAGNTP
jgi:hypothetical protein